MWEEIRKFEYEKVLKKVGEKIKNRKREIGKMALLVAGVVLLSAGIEYVGFGGALKKQVGGGNQITVISGSDIKSEGFVLNEKGEWVAQSSGALLTVETKGIYVNNLEIDLGKDPRYDIEFSYIDPQTQKEVVLKDKLGKSMQKNKLNFLTFAVYAVKSSPAEIKILAPTVGTTVAAIKIDNSYHFNPYRFWFVLAVISLAFFFFIFRKKIGTKPEVAFFAVMFACGTLLAFAELRTYVSWDEAIHFNRADETSFKWLINKKTDDIYTKTNSVPASYALKEQQVLDRNFDARLDKPGKSKSKKNWWEKNSLVGLYNGIAYVPSGLALLAGRILHLPYHLIFVLGRWINVWVYAAVVFFAIRKLKSGKMLMATVALLPTSIFLAANYNYDSWVTAFTLLGLAYLFSELQQPEKKISKSEMAIMLGAFVLGLGPKAIYFLLMLPIFLLKKEKFVSEKQYKKFMLTSALAMLFVLASFMLPFVIGGPGGGDKRGGGEVNAAQQVKFILSEPVAYTKILLNFMAGYVNPLNGVGFVNFFAYLGTIPGFGLLLTILAVVTFTDKNAYDKETSNWRMRTLVWGGYFAMIALISTALYVSFTAVRSLAIAGVQPRYLLPLLFSVLAVLGSWRIKNPFNKNWYNAVIFMLLAAVMLNGIWQTVIKFYY